MDTRNKLSPWTLLLHWFIAIYIIGMLSFGYYIASLPDGPETFKLIQVHKSFGVILLFLALIRLIWRWANGWLEYLKPQPAWQFYLMRSVQGLLIIASIVMPVSGILSSYAGGHDIKVFGYLFITGAEPELKNLGDIAWLTHKITSYLFVALIAIHISAAIKHHFFDKDTVLRRMLGMKIEVD
ncbi:cytochrome b [Microbulbifer sp. SSSA002]|uniref:cytochrome b n=1 Tax=unclassified Microbulbifer TaxID=2619833 RepID=UPI0040395D1F